MFSQAPDHRIASVQKVLQECFWSDYRISEKDILEKLESGDPGFARLMWMWKSRPENN